MSAPSPRPSAFLGIGDNLLGELRVAFRPFAVNVVQNDWFTEAWRLGKAHIAWNDALEYLGSEETTQIRSNLTRKGRAVVIHRKQDPFDFEAGIQRAPNAH